MVNVKVCRVCIKESQVLYNLMQLTALDIDENEVPIYKMLSECCSVTLETSLSIWICSSCSEGCTKAYNFIKLFQKNDETYKKLQKRAIENAQELEIKSENDDEIQIDIEYVSDEETERDPLALNSQEHPNIENTVQVKSQKEIASNNEKNDNGQRIHQCFVCKCKYTSLTSLKRHLKMQHSKKENPKTVNSVKKKEVHNKKKSSTTFNKSDNIERIVAAPSVEVDQPRILRRKTSNSFKQVDETRNTENEQELMDLLSMSVDENLDTDNRENNINEEITSAENILDNKNSNIKKLFECHICKTNLASMYSLKRHSKKKHPRRTKTKTYNLKKKKKNVINNSDAQNNDEYKGRILRKSLSKIENNLPEMNYSKLLIRCPNCENTFDRKRSFDAHLHGKHNNEIIICEECDELFSNPTDYSSHYEQRHYKHCTICEMEFNTRWHFLRHWHYHETRPCYVNLKNNKCPLCPLQERYEKFRGHLKSKHAGKVTCNICQIQFQDIDSFLKHYLDEHRIHCDQCKTYCNSRRQYDTHFNPNFASTVKIENINTIKS